MGLLSSSSSKKSVTNYDNRKVIDGGSDNSISAGGNVTLSDYGAIEGALDLSQANLDTLLALSSQKDDSLSEIVGGVTSQLSASAENSIAAITDAYADAASGGADTLAKLAKWGISALVIGSGLYFWSKK